jgi:hypothetical protein
MALLLSASAAGAALSLYMAPEDLAERADLIVEGEVLRTASGYDPTNGALATYITIEVAAVHRGPDDIEQLVIREPGGRFGNIVHELDAVPRYEPGEEVFVFLEVARDGALRTCGLFFGKYRLDGGSASRDLDGQGTIIGGGGIERESVRAGDLAAVASANGRQRSRNRPRFMRSPPEYDRLLWDHIKEEPDRLSTSPEPDRAVELSLQPAATASVAQTDFIPMNSTNPARWTESDAGVAVTIEIDRSGNPLGDGAAAAAEMLRAMAAWTDVPEARLILEPGDTDYHYSLHHSGSPASVYHGTNVILFDDPYDDISDPVRCSGTLAIGGYWRSSATGDPVNDITFHPALQMYVIFNNDFECWLGDPDNLAEVAAHEMGHGIGFGHSTVPDSIMRSSAYGYRGPRLGDDDCDAAHCHYPHALTLTSPNGGESWEAGSLQSIEWLTTEEQGPSDGEVVLEYSSDGGANWITISDGVENDGQFNWLVPEDAGDDTLVRVARYSRTGAPPPGYPSSCSNDQSDSLFTIVAPVASAGAILPGGGGGLVLEKGPSALLRLGWGPSCSDGAVDYAIYEGTLTALRQGEWDLTALECSAGADLAQYIPTGAGNLYYLVAPLSEVAEGSIGSSSDDVPRPQATAACAPREQNSVCD